MTDHQSPMTGGTARGVVGILRLDFRVLDSRSLKEKRSVVRSFLDSARSRFPVSIAETGYQEDHSLASVTAAVVSARPEGADQVLESLVNLLEADYGVVNLHADGEISEGE
jgi:uncharacterized protein